DLDLRYDSPFVEFLAELPDTAKFQVTLIDVPDRVGFSRIDDQPTLANLISKGRHTPHPHALALGGCDFVADALSSDLPLELGEGEQHIQRQPAHRGGGVE